MCKNEYEVKMQAMDLMSAAINDVVCAMDAIDKFAEAFGLCEDQEAEREKDLKILCLSRLRRRKSRRSRKRNRRRST